jgi:hypothetical protein
LAGRLLASRGEARLDRCYARLRALGSAVFRLVELALG